MGLLTEEQGKDGNSGFTDPRAMGLLGLGASLMQQSGWRHRPISTAEQWGYAIPAGMQAYAQQSQANAQRDEANALLEQEAQAQAQAQAVAQAEQQAELQQKMQFTKAVLGSKLSEPRKNNLLAMWGVNPTEAAKRFDEATAPSAPNVKVKHLTLGKDKDGNLSDQEHQWAIIYDAQGNEIGQQYIGPTGGVTEVRKREEDQESWLKEFKYNEGQDATQNRIQLDQFIWRKRQDGIGNDQAQDRIDNDQAQFATAQSWRELEQDRNYELRKAHHADKLKQFGIANSFTKQEMAAQAARFEKTYAARNAEFAQRFGLDEKKFSDQQDVSKRDFDRRIKEYTEGVTYKEGTETARKAELDRSYNLAVQKFEEQIRATAEKEGFTEEQIENSVSQFAQNLALRKDQFSKKHELALETFGFSQEKWEDQKNQWDKIAKRGAEENDQAFNQRLAEHEYQMVQDAVRADLTALQIGNQVSQFRETFERQGAQFERTYDLKEQTFRHGVEKTDRQFKNELKNREEQKRQYETTLEYKEGQAVEGVRQFKIDYELKEHNFRQRVVQHLATIKQHGETNGLSRDRIKIAQDGLLQRIKASDRSHLLSEEGQNLSRLRFDADQVHRDRKLAQDAINQEYQQGRDDLADKHWDTQFAQRLVEQEAKLVQQGLSQAQAKGIAHANLEFQKFKYQYESDLRPRTLYGEDAKAWAAENSVKIRGEGGTPVVKFDKYGNFEGEVDYIKANKYDRNQLDFLSKRQDKWMTLPDTKAANKLGRLLVSLKTLADKGTGVAEFAMIYKFMKSLDETSTVLASEFRNAAGAGRSALENLEQWGDRQYKGDQLSEKQQTDIIAAVTEIAHAHLTNTIRPNMESYESLATGEGVELKDLKDALPNILEDYFKVNPYKGAAQTTGGTGDKSSLSNADAAAQIDKIK
jgi:hypothetical protein